MEKRMLIILIIILILGYIGWSIFWDSKQEAKLREVTTELNTSTSKVQAARFAKLNLDQMQKKYAVEKENLSQKQSRFINKNEMSVVAKKLKIFAREYNLKLMDFAPVLDTYFSEMQTGKIVVLPINIALHGKYLDIGKFVEDWPQLPFYLIADEIELVRVVENQTMLRAEIKSKLYAWNE